MSFNERVISKIKHKFNEMQGGGKVDRDQNIKTKAGRDAAKAMRKSAGEANAMRRAATPQSKPAPYDSYAK